MGFPKRKQPEPAPDLAEEIHAIRRRIERFVDDRVAELKASTTGRDLPAETLRHMLTHGSGCWCQVALNMLGEQ